VAYEEVQQPEPRRMTWQQLSDEIFAKTERRLPAEVLREIFLQPRSRYRNRSRILGADDRRSLIAFSIDALTVFGGFGTEECRLRYTEWQIELLRSLMQAYYDVQHHGPRKMSWGGICDEIEDKTGVLMDEEVPRQWVNRVKRRGEPRIPDDKNLKAIATFFMHEDIALLDEEELKKLALPRVSHLLAWQLLESLKRQIAQSEPPHSV